MGYKEFTSSEWIELSSHGYRYWDLWYSYRTLSPCPQETCPLFIWMRQRGLIFIATRGVQSHSGLPVLVVRFCKDVARLNCPGLMVERRWESNLNLKYCKSVPLSKTLPQDKQTTLVRRYLWGHAMILAPFVESCLHLMPVL